MRRIVIAGLAVILAGSSVAAAARRGINDSGQCVTECSRSDGAPCRPCLPVIGPGDPNWSAAIREYEQESQQFSQEVFARAERDSGYRTSEQHREDLRTVQNLKELTTRMQAISRLSPE